MRNLCKNILTLCLAAFVSIAMAASLLGMAGWWEPIEPPIKEISMTAAELATGQRFYHPQSGLKLIKRGLINDQCRAECEDGQSIYLHLGVAVKPIYTRVANTQQCVIRRVV